MKVKIALRKILSLFLVACMLFGAAPMPEVSAAPNASSITRMNVQGDEAGVYTLMQAQYAALNKTVGLVYKESIAAGDIVVDLSGSASEYGEEGYSIAAGESNIVVTAATNAGAVYGLQDVLQQLEKGEVTSVAATQPFNKMRALFVDCGRKYFSVSWFEKMIREMAWNGMNTLYLSFSNDEGFRFLLDDMSLSFDDGNGNTVTYDDAFMSHLGDNPKSLADSEFLTACNSDATDNGSNRVVLNYDNSYYLTQSEMVRILKYAKAYGINVIPEFNSPGHIGQVLWYFPEYRIVGTWSEDGQPHYGLDLTKQEAVNFGKALVKKYIDFFAAQGCSAFCVGGDEYAKGNATNEQVAAYTNGLAEYAENKGMTVYAWNDGQAAKNNLLKESVIVNHWDGASSYKSVNFNQNYLYYVLKTNRVWKPEPQKLFGEWTPLHFVDGIHVNDDKVAGSCIAVWCDVPNNETPEFIMESMIPCIQAFGYRTWNYSETATLSLSDDYASYDEFAASVTTAPVVASDVVLATADYESNGTDNTGGTVNVLPEPSEGGGYEKVTLQSPPTPTISSNRAWRNDSPGTNAIDGNTNTYAQTNSSRAVGDYIRVDLGLVQNVDKISVTSPGNNNYTCKEANVQVSEDGTNWITVGTHSGGSSSVTNEYDVQRNVRYIQVVLTARSYIYSWRLSEISWSINNTIIEDGTYIIVNGTNWAMSTESSGQFNNSGGTKIGLNAKQVTIDGDVATPANEIYEWNFEKQSDGTYYITNSEGKYLNIRPENDGNGVIVSDNPQNITATVIAGTGKVQFSNGNDTVNFHAQEKIYSRYIFKLDGPNNQQTLYRKKDVTSKLLTIELYETILAAQEFDNSNYRYDADAFAALQTVLNESIHMYINASDAATTITQEEIDAQTELLREAIADLKHTDAFENYVEIPTTVLDFRADGVMFEYAQNTDKKGLYELLIDTKFGSKVTYANEVVNMPGTIGDRITADEWHPNEENGLGWYYNTKRTGLVEDYLVNGAPVYKEDTVNYVAVLIANGYWTDLSSNGNAANWNATISAKVQELFAGYSSETDTNTNLGSWEDTIAKTSTKANGGDMTWSSITTCYDLAYYVLTNMWRSTEDADGVNAYNREVPERQYIRMLYGEDGYYHLDSTKQISYNGEYIYNTNLTEDNNAETKFTPINGLGYEAGEVFGDTTDTTKNINFHYTLHAQGAFVYSADEDLYFYFDGDDDVYFYINGQLAMDLGGAHAHCDNELYLNDVVDKFGLVDGNIYTFDMFYAERHTTQANLEFHTNIKIMDTNSITTKEQFNAKTGEAIPHGGVVDSGTTVAYSFDLANLRNVPLEDLYFVDEKLGSYLSKNGIVLYDPASTNGAVTDITDMIVYYHAYDQSSVPVETWSNYRTVAVEKTVSEITAMIQVANTGAVPLEYGSYKVPITSESELRALLELGIPQQTEICVYGVKRNVTDTDRPYINELLTRAYYMVGEKRAELNGVAEQRLTVLKSFKAAAEKEAIVVDYGKAIQVPLTQLADNLSVNTGVTVEFYGMTGSGTHGQIRTNPRGISGTEFDKAYTNDAVQGNYFLRGTNGVAEKIEFQPTKMLSCMDKVYAAYKVVDAALAGTDYATYYILVEVGFIPANVMYYETDFAAGVFTLETTGSAWDVDTTVFAADEKPDGLQDAYHYGTEIYGYDSSYDDDTLQSNASSLYVVGQGVKTNFNKDKYTEARFSFTGTGFDIISRTGTEEGAIRVDVYSDEARTQRVKSVTVLNKSESNLTLYQVPVASVELNSHGTYYVTISVNAAYTNEDYPALNRGGNFHFDAIRIYNPVDVSAGIASTGDTLTTYLAYCADGEANAEVKEVRNMLIAAADYDVTASTEGVAFVDRIYVEGAEQQTGVSVADYAAIGPNNEVYLAKGQAIAFKLKTSTAPYSIDIGAKSANGKTVVMETRFSGSVAENAQVIDKGRTINSSTAQYFELADLEGIYEVVGDELEFYVVIKNTGEGILSITDLKLGYGMDITPYLAEVIFDEQVMTAATAFVLEEAKVQPNYDILDAKFATKTGTEKKVGTLKVTTTKDVVELKITNRLGWRKYVSNSYVDHADGTRIWTVKFVLTDSGKQTYAVQGKGIDGTSGKSATAAINVRSVDGR